MRSERVRDVGIDFYPCDNAGDLCDKITFVSFGHRVHLENFVSLFDVDIPILEAVIAVFPGFGIARKCAYERREAVEFMLERVQLRSG